MALQPFLLVNLFWLVFLVPGLAVASYLRADADGLAGVGFLAVRAYLWTSALLAPVVLAAFFLDLSLTPVVVYFVLLVVAALVFLGYRGFRLRKGRSLSVSGYLVALLPALLFAGVLIFDFFLTARVGNILYGDANFHLAKILKTLASGPTTTDPMFGTLTDTRYHYNIIHVVYATAARLTGESPLNVWRYSASFFRLMRWVAMFAFVSYLFPRGGLRYYLTIAFVMSTFMGSIGSTYPNQTQALLLYILVVIVLLEYVRCHDGGEPNARLFLLELSIGTFIIGFSHPSYALYVLALLGVLVLAFLAIGRLSLRRLLPLTPAFTLPLAFPLYSFFQPNHMSELAADFGLSGNKFYTLFGDRLIAMEFNKGQLDLKVVLLAAGLVFAAFMLEDPLKRTLLFASFLTPLVVLHTPFFLGWMLKVVPFWFVARIKFLGAFSPVIYFLPFFGAIELLRRRPGGLGSPRSHQLVSLSLLFLLLLPSVGSISSYWNLRERNDRDLATLRELEDLGENVQPGSVVIADEHYGYLVPSVINARVVYFANEGNANPATPDLPERKRAVQAFFAGNRSAEVLERYVSDPAYVLVKKGDERRAPVNDLELLGTSLHFRLYRLDSG